MAEDPMQAYVDDLLQKAGLDKMPADFKVDYQEKLLVEVQRRLGVVAMKELSGEAIAKFAKLVEKQADFDEVRKFLADNIENYEEKIDKALQELAAEFVTATENLRASLNKPGQTGKTG